ncbi:hypothetical protein B0H17DRAFT_373864 [Mycena rosella]|uniref:Uncharacterized protein n=1 Tax=Mycena rosella TaxID=1033263 RepID=A0AAD7CPB4_MYCRO|nr:hypothetical protein B0H17DRAFT_373864 [Mycena rosella]
MSQLTAHHSLPNELLFKILAHVLAHSVHAVIVSSEDFEWHLRVHHTLSAVCFSFREIMKGISSKAFQFPEDEGLAQHVHRQLTSLRALGGAIRAPATPESFSIEDLDASAPQLVQGYSLYIATVYLRTQAVRSTPEIYRSTSATMVGAVLAFSKALFGRIVPREAAALLRAATEDEAVLAHIGVRVVKHCVRLDALLADEEADEEAEPAQTEQASDAEPARTKAQTVTEQAIAAIAAADVQFRALWDTAPLPCCPSTWLARLPDVYATLARVEKAPALLSEDARVCLRELVERWAPSEESGTSAGVDAQSLAAG